jgi:hypothetical protein
MSETFIYGLIAAAFLLVLVVAWGREKDPKKQREKAVVFVLTIVLSLGFIFLINTLVGKGLLQWLLGPSGTLAK